MCGRYTIVDVSELYERFGVNKRTEGVVAHYNAAPGMMLPVVTRQSPRQVKLMRWGLIPSWAKDPKIGYRMINARVESVATKPSYRKPLSRQRCLVPANGYYEWQREDGKQPYYFRGEKGQLMAMAGLYDTWKDAEGMELNTFTIITTAAGGEVKKIHERMPIILSREDEGTWLDPNLTEGKKAQALLLATKAKKLMCYAVSKAVNNAGNDTARLVTPLEETDER